MARGLALHETFFESEELVVVALDPAAVQFELDRAARDNGIIDRRPDVFEHRCEGRFRHLLRSKNKKRRPKKIDNPLKTAFGVSEMAETAIYYYALSACRTETAGTIAFGA